jgi:uncharacterized protein YdiU (UPF0061 family)
MINGQFVWARRPTERRPNSLSEAATEDLYVSRQLPKQSRLLAELAEGATFGGTWNARIGDGCGVSPGSCGPLP